MVVHAHVRAGAVETEECRSFEQGTDDVVKKQVFASATCCAHKIFFISISLHCNHVICYQQNNVQW